MDTLFAIINQPVTALQAARQRVEAAEKARDKAIAALQKNWPKIHPEIFTELENAKAALGFAEQRELDSQKASSRS